VSIRVASITESRSGAAMSESRESASGVVSPNVRLVTGDEVERIKQEAAIDYEDRAFHYTEGREGVCHCG
jgi:hypothetical protein